MPIRAETSRPTPEATADLPVRGAGLGTFGGVYTPSVLTILGVIMYLRFGWMVGNVGLLGTLPIVTFCTSITFVTALSMASIATDRRVRVGGAYYMTSRSLGIETGGGVGIPLYLAVDLSVALYTIGGPASSGRSGGRASGGTLGPAHDPARPGPGRPVGNVRAAAARSPFTGG